MQSIHEISISGGRPVILLPLTIVIIINGMKDFFEDRKRKVSDDEENNRKCLIFNRELRKFEKKRWSDVYLGKIVKIQENEGFPADLILLSSSEPNGICYIETKSLDGETNLKFRQSNARIYENFDIKNEHNIESFSGFVECKLPNEYIYDFDAKIRQHLSPSDFIYIDKNCFLPRGCSVKQTEHIYGLVVYIGHNTKIMKNSPSARSKISKIESIMNLQIIVIFFVQLSLSFTGAVLNIIWSYSHFEELRSYVYIKENNYKNNILLNLISRIGTWILIFTNLVPISLLVTMEMVKYIQGMFISWDCKIYDREKKVATRVQTSTLNEELGTVKYIFTDKTGTLTKNYMEFKRMSIGNCIYGDKKRKSDTRTLHDKYGEITNVSFEDCLSIFEQDKHDTINDNYKNIELFLECISLCHTVITNPKELANNRIIYQASSPDEMSLINAARYFGFIFKGRDINNNIFMEINGKEVQYRLLNLLEYSSERKKMSVVIKCPDNKIRLYVKGADSVIRDKISVNKELLIPNEKHMMTFAKGGLRTLQIAYRELGELEYESWNKDFLEIVSNQNKKPKLLEDLYDRLERNLYLIGSSGIEDKLQDDVDKTLESLIKAGINIWMLTGDKMDTAISIAFSCKLVTHEFKLLQIPENSKKTDIHVFINNALESIHSVSNDTIKYALVLETDDIARIMSDSILQNNFYKLTVFCKAVICCRASPKQKAQMVNLIKSKRPDATTLAIGDGANDVNMITAAHIGIGIVGVEGNQAARASDYSIGEFSFLKRLLLVHGRECYRKNSFVVVYNFYKNVLFVLPQFWFGTVSYFSGQTLYDPWIYQLFNIVFASFPIIWFGIYDQEIPDHDLEQNPQYYIQGIAGKLFHSIRFWKWVFYGILQGFFLFQLGYYTFTFESSGRQQDLWSIGSMIYASIVIVVNLRIILSTNSHTYISSLLFFLSIFLQFVILLIMSLNPRFENFNDFTMLLFSVNFYLGLFLVVVVTQIIDIGTSKFIRYYHILEDTKYMKPENIDWQLKQGLAQSYATKVEEIRNTCKFILTFFLYRLRRSFFTGERAVSTHFQTGYSFLVLKFSELIYSENYV